MKSKWKIALILVLAVVCIAVLPPVFGGKLSIGGGRSGEAVLQVGSSKALLNGKDAELKSDALYRAEDGTVMIALEELQQAMSAEQKWDDKTGEVSLKSGKNLVQLKVGDTAMKAGEAEAAEELKLPAAAEVKEAKLFVPAQAVAEALKWQYAELPDAEGGFVVLHHGKKPLDEETLKKLYEKAADLFGPTFAQVSADSMIFRAGSDYVCVNGKNTDLSDKIGVLFTPLNKDGEIYLPAAGLITALGGDSEQKDDGMVAFTLDEEEGQFSADGSVTLGGEPFGQKDKSGKGVITEEDILYVSATYAAQLFEMQSQTAGDVAILSHLPLDKSAAVAEQLCAVGNALPEKRPDIPKASAYVALTFDDGPTGGPNGRTAQLLNGLKERGAHATFFMCGYRIKDFHSHMDRYLTEGHEIANHTMDHPGLLTQYDAEFIKNQIQSNSELIASYCGENPTLFRPVGGGINDDVEEQAKLAGLPIINWSVDTEDWKYRDKNHIQNVIVNHAKDGDIVLMHDLRNCTIEGALAAIDILKEKGYAFVTVSELARIKGVSMEPGVLYTNFRDSTVAKLKGGE